MPPTARLILSFAQTLSAFWSDWIVLAEMTQLSSALIVAVAANRFATSIFAALIAPTSALSAKMLDTFNSRAVMVFWMSLPPGMVAAAILSPSTCTAVVVMPPWPSSCKRTNPPEEVRSINSPTVRDTMFASVTARRSIYSCPVTPVVMMAVSVTMSLILA